LISNVKVAEDFNMKGDEVMITSFEGQTDLSSASPSFEKPDECDSLSEPDFGDIDLNDPDEKLVLDQALAFAAFAAPPPYNPLPFHRSDPA